jgi:hypothetical protein
MSLIFKWPNVKACPRHESDPISRVRPKKGQTAPQILFSTTSNYKSSPRYHKNPRASRRLHELRKVEADPSDEMLSSPVRNH